MRAAHNTEFRLVMFGWIFLNSSLRRADVLACAAVFAGAAALAGLGPGPSPRDPIEFPRDHGAHAGAGIEWWYYTGHLRDSGKKEYGFELTFFRVRELSLAHFAWTDAAAKKFRYEEKAHLILPGIADAEAGRLSVSNETWSAREAGGAHQLHASGRDWDLTLTLAPAGVPVIHGEGGISRKGPGEADYSRYVSIPRLNATGTMRSGSASEKVAGTAWFDHEWGPGGLPEGIAGWDWFGIQLDGGGELMLYRMRGKDGSATPFSSGTWIPKDGPPQHLRWKDVSLKETATWKSPKTGAQYPAAWKIAVAPAGLDIAVEPVLPDQELVTEQSTGVIYWEGACRVRGTRAGQTVTGRAYAELTGYARPDVPGFAP
jgi:predicted secreted hydrolase